ncbi:hypothetical protein [Agromyces seonyuensis]|uniref:Methionine synthase n=1 Tax=Agromyces seonyuensis TaxID=2662446 RepID=A0A6I4P7N7_9MICO|nr:hypothetical protein [Agromyces seonyuensis]MWB99827.1 hypothetical protein [Agromyces seonyuensis]
MTEPRTAPQGVHLVGSINQPDAETAFRTVAGALGQRLRRLPDGETGLRFHWIAFQPDVLGAVDGLERVGAEPIRVGPLDVRPLRIADGVDAEDLVLPNLGYADAALESWELFERLQAEGVIPASVKFQVSLPSPAAVIGAFVVPADRARFEPVYRAALFAELDRVLAGVPHDRLAVQWDTAVEFGWIEAAGYDKGDNPNAPWFDDLWAGLMERAAEQAARVPADVEAGWHLCYGDVAEHHFIEPTDTGNLVEFANRLVAASPRPLQWIHLPVPIERDDDAYFAPLDALALPEGTELYLGLVHREDGVEGAERRIAAAAPNVGAFGVATECGFGRSPREATDALLATHATIAAPWA